MEIRDDQLDVHTLISLTKEAVQLLCARDFDTFGQRYPYALAYGRPPSRCGCGGPRSGSSPSTKPSRPVDRPRTHTTR